MKLWEKNYKLKEQVEQFTIGNDREMDICLAEYDILGSAAHAIMLRETGLLTSGECSELITGLKQILEFVHHGTFRIEEGVEDVHSQIELLLTRKLGAAGEKIHTGRSRNDQVLLDLKLFFRKQISETVAIVHTLFEQLLALSEEHKEVLLPGYTHFQAAMPSSFGLWFGAYAESLSEDMELLLAAYRVCNKNPLGSAAGYGSSLPLDRQITTDLLGFRTLNYNSVYAQMSRGKAEKVLAQAIAGIGGTLAKLSMDVCLYMNSGFGFISFPDELTTGSSIMPHKKNPDAWELIRAHCNKLQALPQQLALMNANLPSGYHRDLQLTKELLFPAFGELKDCINMTLFMLQHIEVKKDILNDDKYACLFSVDAVNAEVLEGVPFREAYRNTARKIQNGTVHFNVSAEYTHQGSIGNLCNEEIRAGMNKIIEEFGFEDAEKKLEELLTL